MDTSEKQNTNIHPKLASKVIFRVAFGFIILGIFFFLTAGSVHFWEAWVFCYDEFV